MKTKAVIAFLGIASAAAAFPAAAQMSMSAAYLGGGIGQSKFKDSCSNLGSPGGSCDDKDTAWKLFGGYQFNRNFAAELGYSDLGKAKADDGAGATVEAKSWATDLSAIGSIPFDAFSIFGRLGGYYGKTDLTGFASGSKSTSNLTYGAGAQYDFSKSLGVRGEWQRYNKMKARDDASGTEAESNVDVLGVSLLYRFQ